MTPSGALPPHENPKHPLYHFLKRLPPPSAVKIALPSGSKVPLQATPSKLVTAVDSLATDVKAVNKDLNGLWSTLNGLREQQKALATRGEAEEDIRDILVPAIQRLEEQQMESTHALTLHLSTKVDAAICSAVNKLNNEHEEAHECMLFLRQLPEQLKAITPLLELLAAGISEYASPTRKPPSAAMTPEATPDFLRWSSSPGVHVVAKPCAEIPELPRAGRPQTSAPPKATKRKRKITLDMEEADVEAPLAQLLRKPPFLDGATHLPFRKPSRKISELKLPIAETQTPGIRSQPIDGRVPSCDLQPHFAQLGKKGPRKARRRFLDPGTEEDD